METSLWIICFQRDLQGVLNITKDTENSDNTAVVCCFSVETKRVLEKTLGFKILSPPFVKVWFSLLLNEMLEPIEVSLVTKHSWNFNSMSVTQDEMLDGSFNLLDTFEVLGEGVVSVFQVNSVVLLGNFNGFVPLTTSLMQLAE